MKLVPADKKKLGWYKTTSNYELINEFIESGMDCAEIADFTQKDAQSCANSIKQTIKRYRVFNVQVITRQGRVFLIRDKI